MPERKREDREGTEELCSVTVGNDKKHLPSFFCSSQAFCGLLEDISSMFALGHLPIFLKVSFLMFMTAAKSLSVL